MDRFLDKNGKELQKKIKNNVLEIKKLNKKIEEIETEKLKVLEKKDIFEFLSQEMTRKTSPAIIWMLMREMNWLHKYYDRDYYFLT